MAKIVYDPWSLTTPVLGVVAYDLSKGSTMFRHFFGPDKGQVEVWRTALRRSGDPAILQPSDTTVSVSLREQITACVRAGYHRYARSENGTVGFSSREYASLWPATIRLPEIEHQTSTVLLVDRTLSPEGLARFVSIETRLVRPDEYRDVVAPPVDEVGNPLLRYIALFQDGYATGNNAMTTSADDFCAKLPPDRVPLVGIEAVHVAVQYGERLRARHLRYVGPYSMRVPGTTVGRTSVLCLQRSEHGLMKLTSTMRDTCNNTAGKDINDFCGNASRLTRVIPVP